MPQLFKPVGGALQLVRRNGRGVGYNEAAFAQIRDFEQGNVSLSTFHVIVDEVVHVGRLVGVDPSDRFPNSSVKRSVGLGIDTIGGDFGAVKE